MHYFTSSLTWQKLAKTTITFAKIAITYECLWDYLDQILDRAIIVTSDYGAINKIVPCSKQNIANGKPSYQGIKKTKIKIPFIPVHNCILFAHVAFFNQLSGKC